MILDSFCNPSLFSNYNDYNKGLMQGHNWQLYSAWCSFQGQNDTTLQISFHLRVSHNCQPSAVQSRSLEVSYTIWGMWHISWRLLECFFHFFGSEYFFKCKICNQKDPKCYMKGNFKSGCPFFWHGPNYSSTPPAGDMCPPLRGDPSRCEEIARRVFHPLQLCSAV